MIFISTLSRFKHWYSFIIVCVVTILFIWLSIGRTTALPLETQLEKDAVGKYQELHFVAEKGVLYTLQNTSDLVDWDDDLSFIGGGQLVKLRLFALHGGVAPENGNDAPFETVSAQVRSVSSGGTYVSWISLEDQSVKHLYLTTVEIDPNFPVQYAGLKNGFYLFLNLYTPLTVIDSDSVVVGKDLSFKNALVSILTGINADAQNGVTALRPHRPHTGVLGDKKFWRIKSDPDVDSDGDGISNTQEVSDGTDILDDDSDNDGTPDGQLLDTDGDSVPDIYDADPLDKAVTWKKVAENPYVVIDLGLPAGVDLADDWSYDLGEGGHVLLSRFDSDLPVDAQGNPVKAAFETYIWHSAGWSANLSLADHLRGRGTVVDALGNVYGKGKIAVKVDTETAGVTYNYIKWEKNANAATWQDPVAELNGNVAISFDTLGNYENLFGSPITIEPRYLNDTLLYGKTGHFSVKTHAEKVAGMVQVSHSMHRLSPVIGDPFLVTPSQSSPTNCHLVGEPNGWHAATWIENEGGVGNETKKVIFSKLSKPNVLSNANLPDNPEDPARYSPTGLASIAPEFLPTIEGENGQVNISDIVIWQHSDDFYLEGKTGFQIGQRKNGGSNFTWQTSTKADASQRIGGKINSRGEGLEATKLWRNGSWTPLDNLVDSSLWPYVQGIDINDSGAILARSGAKLILLMPPVVIIEEVHLTAQEYENQTILKNDANNKRYDLPQWLDKNGDGDPSDAVNGEQDYPSAFVHKTKPSLGAVFKVTGTPLNQNFKVRATGCDGIKIPETDAIIRGGKVVIDEIESVMAWPEGIKFYDRTDPNKAFKIEWEMKIGNSDWFKCATTKHQVYITLGVSKSSYRMESLFYIGCKYGDGNKAEVTARHAIYKHFEGRQVKRIDGKTMHYYLGGNEGALDMNGLLKSVDGNGNCGAWSDLLMNVLQAQGIEATLVGITPKGDDNYLVVNNVLFKDLGISGSSGYPYASSYADKVNLGNEVVGAEGEPGQGPNKKPWKVFSSHCILKSGGKYYDPSYGTSPFTNKKMYEDSVFAGYAKDANTSNIMHVRKNNTTNATSEVEFSN